MTKYKYLTISNTERLALKVAIAKLKRFKDLEATTQVLAQLLIRSEHKNEDS